MTTIGDLLVEFKEKPGKGDAPPVLTLTERKGFVRQTDRFNKRLATDDTSNYKVVRRNDIAFNPYLLWAGAVAQNTIVDEGVISPLYPTFRVRDDHDPRYVARLLLTPQLIGAYDGIAFGSVPRRRRSSVSDFLSLPLASVPPLPEQRRIAAILDHADALRTKRRQVLAHLDSLPQSIFHRMFGSRRYTLKPLGELTADTLIGLVRSSAQVGPEFNLPYMKMDAITRDGGFDRSLFTRTDASDRERQRFEAREGDLLFNTRNTSGLVGKTTIFRGEPALFNNNLMRIRFSNEVDPVFVHSYLWSVDGRRQLDARKSGTTSVFAIYAKDLMTVQVPVPPLAVQQEFATRVGEVGLQRDAIQRALAADDELFASLQARAFQGTL